jgi:YesN/AraC family two-component response regulator
MAALGAFRQDPGKFDLVISDQTMPEMTGIQLISELKQIRSDIPCILCTGYSDKITEQNHKEFGITSLLLKPVTRREMADAVYRVLA